MGGQLRCGGIDTSDDLGRAVGQQLPGSQRHIYAATYGEPPDPPAVAALLSALAEAATSTTSSAVTSSVTRTSSTSSASLCGGPLPLVGPDRGVQHS